MYDITEILNSLHEGDCLKIMKLFPNKSIDLILCDLPYGTTKNKWDTIIDFKELWKEYERIIKDNGAIILTSHQLFTAKLILSNEKLFKYKIVWNKCLPTNFLNANKQFLRIHEDICVFYKKQPKYNPQKSEGKPYKKKRKALDIKTGNYNFYKPNNIDNKGERFPTDIIKISNANRNKTGHPTEKPVELGEYLIKTFTIEGEIVLDNCFGSGSFLEAAAKLNRKFIGIEINNENNLKFNGEKLNLINIAKERIIKNSNLNNEDIKIIKYN